MEPKSSHILIVDDDEFIRDMLSARLTFWGYQLTTASGGGEALQLLQQERFDLILLDIMMPVVDGFEVLRQLKLANNSIPVVVMSAQSEQKSVIECIQLGAEDYLSKPIAKEILRARIAASLEKKYFRDAQQTWLEELNLLQQIEQELNTTLNRAEVSHLTLKWVVQKTAALAGFVGSVEGDFLRLRAVHGLKQKVGNALALATVAVDAAQRNITQTPVPENGRLHSQATHRIILPIVRNTNIHDMVVLDLPAPVPDTTIRFLRYLSTHIAIALHNAQLYADVRRANETKSNFVAMVSHELKNPLTAIQSYTYLLNHYMSQLSPEKQLEYLDIIANGAEHIHNLALELDDITQIETGQFRLKIANIAFPQVLADVLKLLDPQINERKQTIKLNIPQEMPLVQADAKRLGQILTNLISNASKYTPESGRITVSARLMADELKEMLQVNVQDTGIGIAPEDKPKIFSEFFRADDPQVSKIRGTGLGLNITQKLVELQGGEIGFTSKYSSGSTFYFTIPVVAAKETAVTAVVQPVA